MSNSFNISYNAGGTVDKVKNIKEVEHLNSVDVVQKVAEIGGIQGFATKNRPYNSMVKIDVPAGLSIVEEEIDLPDKDVEILALTLTCSGYGEDDHYDLWFNDQLWFDKWYCSEVKEGLFLGTSTYVYVAPPKSKIRLRFYNTSQSSKKVWLGIRMLVDDVTTQSDYKHVKKG